ncbi:hypothetical protein D3C81_2094870 [compost metagenome]
MSEAMHDGIFHQRLEGGFGDQSVMQGRIHLMVQPETVAEPGVLDLHICADQPQLLLEMNQIHIQIQARFQEFP